MFIIQEVMKRRRVLVAAGLCLSFFLGTWMNLLSEPGFEHQQVESYHEKQTRHRDTGDSQLHVGESLGAETITGSSTREPEAPGSLHELQLQIRERYDEVLRYRRIQAHRPGQRDLGRPLERRRLMDLEPGDNWNPARAKGWTVHRQVHRNPAASTATRAAPHGRAPHGVNGAPLLGCSSIRDVTDVQYLGSGYTKSVYKAALNRSLSVALKSVDFAGHDMENCVKKYGATGACYRLSSFKIIKEMVLMETLQHPNILKLYGYCYQDNSGIQDTVTAITELGGPLEMIHLLQTPWEERFRICLSLVRLLLFLSRSPLGSVSLLDFRPRQFVLVNGELKVTDLDDASVHEAPCVLLTAHQCTLQFPARNFSLPCTRGRCEGINEKRNLYNAYRFFFTYLLPHSAPSSLRPLLDRIVNATGELLWGVEETLSKMEEVLQLYRTGVYLQNDTRHNAAGSVVVKELGNDIYTKKQQHWWQINYNINKFLFYQHFKEDQEGNYKEAWDTSIPGQDLRCWPSYQHDACLLAVFSLKEAVSVCERHAHCGAFVFTNRTTWTGHNLVYFKSGWTGLSQASGQRTYIRLGS